MNRAREVKIDEVDMEALDLPDIDIDELFTTQPERWIDILVDAGQLEMAEDLRREILRRKNA